MEGKETDKPGEREMFNEKEKASEDTFKNLQYDSRIFVIKMKVCISGRSGVGHIGENARRKQERV